jgi:hypothetical protein
VGSRPVRNLHRTWVGSSSRVSSAPAKASLVHLAGVVLLPNSGFEDKTSRLRSNRFYRAQPAAEVRHRGRLRERSVARSKSAGDGSVGGPQARVQHHCADLQRAAQRVPHRLPHLQAPPVSTSYPSLSHQLIRACSLRLCFYVCFEIFGGQSG